MILNLTDTKETDLYVLPIIKYEHSEDIYGIKQNQFHRDFVLIDSIKYEWDDMSAEPYDVPTIQLGFSYRINVYSRMPAQTIM